MSTETVALITALLASVTSVAAVVLAGWISHRVSVDQRRSEKRIDTLIEAFRKLDSVSNRRIGEREAGETLESAISDVVLLGSDEEVREAIRFSSSLQDHGSADMTDLLRVLRSSLRRELNLDQIDDYVSLRISDRPEQT